MTWKERKNERKKYDYGERVVSKRKIIYALKRKIKKGIIKREEKTKEIKISN